MHGEINMNFFGCRLFVILIICYFDIIYVTIGALYRVHQALLNQTPALQSSQLFVTFAQSVFFTLDSSFLLICIV